MSQMGRPKRPAEKTLGAIEEVKDGELERLGGLSPTELDNELADQGLDGAKRKAAAARLESSTVANPQAIPRWVIPMAIAAGFVLVLTAAERGAIVAWFSSGDDPDEKITHPDDVPGSARAMRHDAAKAVSAGAWIEARDLLDKAKALDPKGDLTAHVQSTRTLIQRVLDAADAAMDTADAGTD